VGFRGVLGSCLDKVVEESFFPSFKHELDLDDDAEIQNSSLRQKR
jgi:hypothetical protein